MYFFNSIFLCVQNSKYISRSYYLHIVYFFKEEFTDAKRDELQYPIGFYHQFQNPELVKY